MLELDLDLGLELALEPVQVQDPGGHDSVSVVHPKGLGLALGRQSNLRFCPQMEEVGMVGMVGTVHMECWAQLHTR
jgi:hypothetical protein